MRPICRHCNSAQVEERKYKDRTYYTKTCYPCRVRPWTRHKKSHCEECGFIAKERCQLDVDHIDGDKHNNELSNLRTLCANCHRLQTFLKKQFINRAHRGLE